MKPVLVILALSSCTHRVADQPPLIMEGLLPKGYQCFVTPSSFDPPGVIFSIDKSGVKDYVANLSNKVPKTTATLEVGSLTATRTMDATFAAKLLSMSGDVTPVSVDGQSKRMKTISVRLVRPITQELTMQSDTEKIGEWFERYLHSQSYDPERSYYVVREAILAQGVDYTLDNALVEDLGGKAKILRYAEASGRIKIDDHDGFKLVQNFKRPLRVCIKPQELIQRSPPLNADGSARYRRRPADGTIIYPVAIEDVENLLVISSERSTAVSD